MKPAEYPVRVLVVDDELDDLNYAQMLLTKEGYAVATATTCRQARSLLAETSYEILIVDLRLPDGDGLDLLIAARERNPHAVAMLLTGYNSPQQIASAMRGGAFDYLTKPCQSEVLLATVKHAAEKYRLTREVERLAEINEGQAQFMDNAIHEMKNPLSVVRGYIDLLARSAPGNAGAEEFNKSLGAIRRNIGVLYSLIDELVDSARLSAHKIHLNPQPLRADDEVAQVVESFELQAREKGITLVSTCVKDGGPVFQADPLRLRQVLSNLIANAIKFTPSGGRILAGAALEGDQVHFCVEDTGIGIAPAHLDRIFDRYYQSEGPGKEKGLGLGLEISRGLVALHGGRIWAESEVGKGSKFHFTLPLMAMRMPSGESTAPARSAGASALSRLIGG